MRKILLCISVLAPSLYLSATYRHNTDFGPDLDSIQGIPKDAHLNYYGGPVVSNVQVVSVLWGPNTNKEIANMLPEFLGTLVNSEWIDQLAEYSTANKESGTNQIIGRGSFIGQVTITPQNTDTRIDDNDVMEELRYQIEQKNIPQPQFDELGFCNTLYMVEFPPEISIYSDGFSCRRGGFCAYHSSLDYNGKPVLYSVHPDMGPSSGCHTGCGEGSLIQNARSVYSHELAEAITDPQVNLAPGGFRKALLTSHQPIHYPLAWYDYHNGENADVCNAHQAECTLNGKTYTVQKLWSNEKNDCVAPPLLEEHDEL